MTAVPPIWTTDSHDCSAPHLDKGRYRSKVTALSRIVADAMEHGSVEERVEADG